MKKLSYQPHSSITKKNMTDLLRFQVTKCHETKGGGVDVLTNLLAKVNNPVLPFDYVAKGWRIVATEGVKIFVELKNFNNIIWLL